MFDIHCHILPGVDDGSRSFSESREMLQSARAIGINEIVATPHLKVGEFDQQRIWRSYEVMRDEAAAQGIHLTLGYEVHWLAIAEYGIAAMQNYVFEGTNLLLIEYSVGHMPANWQQVIRALQQTGIQPIIAHPERYHPIQDNIDIAYEMKDMGCLLQLSANFIGGENSSTNRKKTAERLLRAGAVDYICSDAHRARHYAYLPDALKFARKFS